MPFPAAERQTATKARLAHQPGRSQRARDIATGPFSGFDLKLLEEAKQGSRSKRGIISSELLRRGQAPSARTEQWCAGCGRSKAVVL